MRPGHYIALAACIVLVLLVAATRARAQAMADTRDFRPLDAVLARSLRCDDVEMLVKPLTGAVTPEYIRALTATVSGATLGAAVGKHDWLTGVVPSVRTLSLAPGGTAVRVPIRIVCPGAAAAAPEGTRVALVDYGFGPE